MSKLQRGWKKLKLKDLISKLQSGLSRKLSSQDIGLPLITSGNIVGDKFNSTNLKYWYRDDPQGDDTSKYFLFDGDILLSFINSFAKIGYPAIYKSFGRDVIFSTNLFRIKSKTSCDQNYLFYLLGSELIRTGIYSITKPAVNQASFTKPDFLSLDCIAPPFEEQKKIAVILTSVDKVIELTEIEIEKLKNLKKGMMQDLLTKGIGHTKFKNSPLGKIPESWTIVKLQDISRIHYGKSPNEVKVEYSDFKIWGTGGDSGYAKKKLFNGPFILIGRKGTINKPMWIESSGWVIDTAYAVESNSSLINLKFLFYLLLSSRLEDLNESTGVPSLSRDNLYKLKLAIPSNSSEQSKIANILTQMDNKISSVVQKLIMLNNLKKGLMQDLFTGKVRVKV